MSVVLPESMERLNEEDKQDAKGFKKCINTIENYIHYIEERIDYFTTIDRRKTDNKIIQVVDTIDENISSSLAQERELLTLERKQSEDEIKSELTAQIQQAQQIVSGGNGVFKVVPSSENPNVNTGWEITTDDGSKIVATAGGIALQNGGETKTVITGDGVIATSLLIGDQNLENFISLENGKLKIGNSSNAVLLQMESDSIVFTDTNGVPLARFTPNGLEFAKTSFQRLQLGNYMIRARSDGSIYFAGVQ